MTVSVHTGGLLRFLTAGSVDDGKSTLIGRLLYESGGVYDDQISALHKITQNNGNIDLSLITDGLRAEREQAITIDVAYRYFSTPKRTFIIADAPGHEQYTANMVTAASTADLAVILLDARKGLLEQTRRHAYIAWMLGIRTIIVAVNKMDLVNFDRETFSTICDRFTEFASLLNGVQNFFVPISALCGDNVVRHERNMAWYSGPTLLELLETVSVEENRGPGSFRFPVQGVVRPNQDFRGYSGQIISGSVKSGQEVLALPSQQRTRITQIMIHKQQLEEARPPQSVVLSLSNHIDLGRGDMLVDPDDRPVTSQRVMANLIWMSRSPLRVGTPYLIKHTVQTLCGSIIRILSKLDIQSVKNVEAVTLHLNEIGKVEVETHKPIFCEPYVANHTLGSFIVIEPVTNDTIAGGIIIEASPFAAELASPSLSILSGKQSGQQGKGVIVWFTGLSGAGKSTISNAVHTELLARGIRSEMLDGDAVRKHLSSDLGFSKKDRDENIRRMGFVANLLSRNGVVVLVSAISPYRTIRDEIRRNTQNFVEVHVDAPLDICEQRDPKGLYKKARAGEISGFTGIDDPYEPPLSPEIRCDTHQETVKSSTEKVVQTILEIVIN